MTKDNKILITALAKGLEEYCERWSYDYIENLKKNTSVDNFIKQFLKITKTHFFKHEENTYGATFDKKEKSVKIYMCGKNHENILVDCPIEDVVKELGKLYK